MLLLPFYLLLEADSLQRRLPAASFRADHRQRAARITRDVTVKVGAWLGGQLLLGVIIGVTATIGFWLLGVPYFYVLGLLAGVRRDDPGRRPDPRGGAGDSRGADGVAADGALHRGVFLRPAVRREQLPRAAIMDSRSASAR